MRWKLLILMLVLGVLVVTPTARAQTSLAAGDIAIIGVNSDNPDDFAFIPLVDLAASTEIKFTDNGWQSAGSFRANEGIVTYTAPSTITAGTVITFAGNSNFASTSGSFALSVSGDQVLAYQGQETSPTFLFAVQTNSTQWQADATDSNTSALPTGLTDGVNAVAVGQSATTEYDNAVYNESVTSGDAATLLAAIANAANWNGDSDPLTMPTGPFTVSGGTDTTPPQVVSTTPADGAGNVATDASITVTFNETVDVIDNPLSVSCPSYSSTAFDMQLRDDVTSFTFDPPDFAPGETCTATVIASGVQDTAGNTLDGDANGTEGGNYVFSFTVASADGIVLISDVQGSPANYGANNFNGKLDESPQIGNSVTVQGIVVGDFQEAGEFSGFYVQEETADWDGDAATSEGIFVFCDTTCQDVSVGNQVTVTGAVDEYFNQTQIDNDNGDLSVTIDASGQLNQTSPVTVNFPLSPATTDDEADPQEAFEGMWVQVGTTMHITEFFEYDRYSQLLLWSDGTSATRPYQFTAQNAPDVANFSQSERDFIAQSVYLDDGSSVQGTAPKPYPANFLLANGVNAANGFRGGDSILAGWDGIMNYSRERGSGGDAAWRIFAYDPSTGTQPDGDPLALTFNSLNPRPASPPSVGGSLRVASFNVLNYFTTLDSRGADTLSEFNRQRAKIIDAICGLDADIVGLMELENNYVNGGFSAINDLVGGLNGSGACNGRTYTYVDLGSNIGTDVIAVGFIYDTGTVQPASGTIPAILTDSALAGIGYTGPTPVFDGPSTSRAPLAVTFEANASGEQLTIAVNHFKSKGGTGFGDNADAGDGQGNWNARRTNAAEALALWLNTKPTGTTDDDVLIIGDLNAYDEEDPITALESAGYTDLIDQYTGDDAYGFVFDGRWGYLDYAMANDSLLSQVTGTAEWHINADEPDALDYNEDFNPSGWYEPNAFRASDHDPVIVGLNLSVVGPDVNGDGFVTPADAVYVINRIGTGAASADVDGDGNIDADDVQEVINQLGQ